MFKKADTSRTRQRRHARVRRTVRGVAGRPRLSVFRSLSHIYAQIVDDAQGITLAAASSRDPDLREGAKGKKKAEVSALVGEVLARRARERGVTQVVFDRGGYLYHGRVKALADGARKAGLQF